MTGTDWDENQGPADVLEQEWVCLLAERSTHNPEEDRFVVPPKEAVLVFIIGNMF